MYARGCVRDQIGERIPSSSTASHGRRNPPRSSIFRWSGRWEILREGAIPTHEIVMVLQR